MSLDQAFNAVNDMKKAGDVVRNQSAESRVELNALAEIDAFGGNTAQTLRRLIHTQYTPLLMAVENAYWKQGVKAREMVETFMEVMGETDRNARFNHDALISLGIEIDNVHEEMMSLNAELQSIYFNINDIMTLSMPNTTQFERNYASAQNSLRATRERLGGFTFSFREIEDLLAELEHFVRKLNDNRGLDPASDARRNIFNSGQFNFAVFAENMSELHNEFLAVEASALEELIRSWEGQDIETILMSLSNPMTQTEQLAFMGLLGSMSDDAFNIFASLTSYVWRPDYLSEVGLKWFLEFGIANVENLRRPIYVGLRSSMGVTNAHHESVRRIDFLRGIGKGLKKALPWLSFGVGTALGIWNGNSIGQAVSYSGTSTTVALLGGSSAKWAVGTTAGKAILTFIGLSTNPIGWSILGGIAAGFTFKLLYDYTPLGYAVDFIGDVIDAIVDSTVAGWNNMVNFVGDLWHADNWGEAREATVDLFNNGVDNVINFATDIWDAGINFVDNKGQAISGTFESLNPFNWSWGR